MKVYCKATFRDFPEDTLSFLKHEIENFSCYQYIKNVYFVGNYVLDNNPDDPKAEWEFGYEVPVDEEVSERNLCHTYVSSSIREINLVCDDIRGRLSTKNMKKSSTISISLVSKEIFPKKFALRCLTLLTGFYMGNIVNKCEFLPTTYVAAPLKNMSLMQDFMTYTKNEGDIEATMTALFEHDRKAVNIMFPDEYVQNTQRESRLLQRIVELQANYSAIRKVIFHFDNRTDSNQFFADVILQLSAPVEVYIYKITEENKDEPGKFRPFGLRFLTWNKRANYEESIAHASCFRLNCVFQNGRNFLDLVDRLQKAVGQIVEFRRVESLPLVPIAKYIKKNLMEFDWLKNEKYFPLAYAIEALTSRGGPVYDHFFHPVLSDNGASFEKFVKRVTETYNHDEQEVAKNHAGCSRTVAVLEEMLTQIDRNIDVLPPLKLFDILYNDTTLKFSNVLTDLSKDGYMRVRKIVITPTRKLYVSPELIMGNRSLRALKPENMLRVIFRDDNNRMLSSLPEAIINDTVVTVLSKVLIIGCQEFSYLGSSNSQMRDHGCYFIRGSDVDAVEFRKSCGKFSTESIPKLMSRIGQVFTQSHQLGVILNYNQYSDSYDYTGGRDSNGKPYIFSDGVEKLVAKMQIRIPRSLGRMMFGVVDETGLLQYGQVFFQYTIDCDVKYPTANTPKCIHKGRVMITKNPSVVAGDVRMFEAVDIPALHDLVDVIVFPQSGPRPHPDEMAGSDLDGDEYSIIWDPIFASHTVSEVKENYFLKIIQH